MSLHIDQVIMASMKHIGLNAKAKRPWPEGFITP